MTTEPLPPPAGREEEVISALVAALRRLLPATEDALRREARHEAGCKCAIHEARAAIREALTHQSREEKRV